MTETPTPTDRLAAIRARLRKVPLYGPPKGIDSARIREDAIWLLGEVERLRAALEMIAKYTTEGQAPYDIRWAIANSALNGRDVPDFLPPAIRERIVAPHAQEDA